MRAAVLFLALALAGCEHDAPPTPAIIAPAAAPIKQACLKIVAYTPAQEAGFAREDEALKASGKFPLTEMRLADYGAERAALRACAKS